MPARRCRRHPFFRLNRNVAAILALSAGLALSAAGARASAESHGDAHAHGEASAAAPAKTRAPGKEEREKGEGKLDAKPLRVGMPVLSKTLGDEPPKNAVSMSELRELIDQKIAEVRAKQTTAPVVKVPSRSPRPKRDPALIPAVYRPELNNAEGALLPANASGHGGGAALAAKTAMAGGAGRPMDMGHDVHWAYSGDTGPQNWAQLKPEYRQCMLGKRQSPIDIRDGIPVQLDDIQFDYRPTAFKVIDNGHTVQVNVEPGNSIVVQGRRYDLVQFHFHRPSEERINGRQYEMVAHLVHKDPEGRLAVVAVLMDQGKSHPMVQLVWNSLPLEKEIEQSSMVPMDLGLLLPEKRHYYTYMGSLTTPPCSEGVLWMVMKSPATMSRDQIAVFSRLYPMNARPIQSAAGRLIKDGQ